MSSIADLGEGPPAQPGDQSAIVVRNASPGIELEIVKPVAFPDPATCPTGATGCGASRRIPFKALFALPTYIAEYQLSVAPRSDVNFVLSLKNAASDRGVYNLVMLTRNEWMALRCLPNCGGSLTNPILLPGLRSGRTITVTAAVELDRITLFLDQAPVAQVAAPAGADRRPDFTISGPGIDALGKGAVRILSARFYELPSQPIVTLPARSPGLQVPTIVRADGRSGSTRTPTQTGGAASLGGIARPFIGTLNDVGWWDYAAVGWDVDQAIRDARRAGIKAFDIRFDPSDVVYNPPSQGRSFEWRLQIVDRLLNAAAEVGMHVIVTFTDFDVVQDGPRPAFRDDATYLKLHPYADFADASALKAFEDYITALLTRKNTVNGKVWRDDDTILAWDIASEPTPRPGGTLRRDVSCEDLRSWVTNVAAFIKGVDPRHLVTIELGDPLCLSEMDISALDFVSMHYVFGTGGDQYRPEWFVETMERAVALGKPFVLSQFAVKEQVPSAAYSDRFKQYPRPLSPDTIAQLRAVMDAAFCSGVAGFMFQGWAPREADGSRFNGRALADFNAGDSGLISLLQGYRVPYPVRVGTPLGSVTGGGCYEEGATATLAIDQTTVALPDGTRSVFVGWTGDVNSTEPKLTLTISSPISVKAVWQVQR